MALIKKILRPFVKACFPRPPERSRLDEMGVYVFDTVSDWVKVGHYTATRGRPNAYYRIAGKGFYKLKHPSELDDLLGVQHLTLLAWYPTLGIDVERRIHRECAERVGEFHPRRRLASILETCDALGERKGVTASQRDRALQWGWRKARKARKRRNA